MTPEKHEQQPQQQHVAKKTPAPSFSPLVIVAKPRPKRKKCTALLFTMDSTTQFENNARRGGASGEITIRRSLTDGLGELGCTLEIARSDAEFIRMCPSGKCGEYAFLVLDAWTWAGPGWKPKPNLIGLEPKIFLLDFFGASGPRGGTFDIPPRRILTAFPTFPGNTYLGYFLTRPTTTSKKEAYGVIWGKDPNHYKGKAPILRSLLKVAPLHSTLSRPPPELRGLSNLTFHGHLDKEKWSQLLEKASFLLGLGNPLLGPSAVDAVAHGCVYIDPAYPEPVNTVYDSQHPYLRDSVGEPYVCSSVLDDPESNRRCAENALAFNAGGTTNTPVLLPDLTKEAYLTRLRKIFGSYLQEEVEQVGEER